MTKNIVIFKCIDCNFKKVFENDLEKITEKDIKEFQGVQYKHSLHAGYIFTTKYNTKEDKIKVMSEIRSWFVDELLGDKNVRQPEVQDGSGKDEVAEGTSK